MEPINSPAWRSSSTEELLIVDEDSSNFLGRKTQFSLRVWLLIGLPHCRGWPHTCEHKGRTDWTGWVMGELRGHEVGTGWGLNMIKTHCIQLRNYQKINSNVILKDKSPKQKQIQIKKKT